MSTFKEIFDGESMHDLLTLGVTNRLARMHQREGKKKVLTSLEGMDEMIGPAFKWDPDKMSLTLNTAYSKLKDLKGMPVYNFGADLNIDSDTLASLEGMSKVISGDMFIQAPLKRLDLECKVVYSLRISTLSDRDEIEIGDCDISVGGSFTIRAAVRSFKDIHKKIRFMKSGDMTNGKFRVAQPHRVESHVLGILLIDGIKGVNTFTSNEPLLKILNDAIKQFTDPRKRVMWAQAELIKQLGELGKALAQL